MKRMQMLVLCVVALGATGAIASASASASLPEYRFCVKAEPAKTGEYTENLCATHAATPGTGAWELESWEHGVKRTFTGKIGVSTHDEYIPENEATPWTGGSVTGTVQCKSGTTEGEVTGAKTSTETVEFATCTIGGNQCTTPGEKGGVVHTHLLKGELGYIVSGTGTGTRLSAAEGEVIAEFNCGSVHYVQRGSLIGVDTGNVNKASKEAVLNYAVNSKGGQQIVFGEFPAGEGPFYLTSFQTPVEANIPEAVNMVVTNKQKGSALEIRE